MFLPMWSCTLHLFYFLMSHNYGDKPQVCGSNYIYSSGDLVSDRSCVMLAFLCNLYLIPSWGWIGSILLQLYVEYVFPWVMRDGCEYFRGDAWKVLIIPRLIPLIGLIVGGKSGHQISTAVISTCVQSWSREYGYEWGRPVSNHTISPLSGLPRW